MRYSILFLALVACCVTEPVPVSLFGTYDLVSLNGGSLPQVIASVPPEVIQVTGGKITLNADGTFADQIRGRTIQSYPLNTSVEDSNTVTGTYTRQDSTVRLVPAAREPYMLTRHADGSLTRFFPRHDELGGPYLDVTYRYVKRR